MKYEEMAISVTELNSYIKNKIADDEYLDELSNKFPKNIEICKNFSSIRIYSHVIF